MIKMRAGAATPKSNTNIDLENCARANKSDRYIEVMRWILGRA